MISEKEKQSREELFKLMRENPELPIVPMVDSDIVADNGYAYWKGAWGSSSIMEYLVGEESVHFREDDDWEEVERTLTDGFMSWEQFESMTDVEAGKAYASLPWIKAIVVYINLPES